MAVQLFQRLVAQPALGAVVDPLKRQIIARLCDQPQIGERIAHFGAFVKAEAADDLVIQSDRDEAVFEFAGLELRADQDRSGIEARLFALQPFQLFTHPAGFFRAIPHANHADLVSAANLGPQGLAKSLAVGIDQTRGSSEDIGGRAIVLLQLDYFGAGKILFKPQDIGDFCAAPGIDRLIVIPHHADVVARLGEQAQPQVLDLIGVLIFIDHDIFEALLILLQHVAMAAQDVQHVQQQIAEIASIERFQTVLIQAIELLPLAVGIGLAVRRAQIDGAQSLVFPAINAPGQLPRGPTLVIHAFSLNQLLQHAQLIVGIDDRVVRLQPDQLGMAAQHLGGDGVERAEPRHPFYRRANQVPNPLLHFARSLVGEGNAEDFAGPGEPRAHDIGQPRGQRSGLAGTGPGQHQHRPLGGLHRLALRRVKRGQQRVMGRREGFWHHG